MRVTCCRRSSAQQTPPPPRQVPSQRQRPHDDGAADKTKHVPRRPDKNRSGPVTNRAAISPDLAVHSEFMAVVPHTLFLRYYAIMIARTLNSPASQNSGVFQDTSHPVNPTARLATAVAVPARSVLHLPTKWHRWTRRFSSSGLLRRL